MPKRAKHKDKPMDINQAAFRMVEMSTKEEAAEKPPKKQPKKKRVAKSDISRVMSLLGRKGGKKGGKRRLETLTAEQRSKIALEAAKARWNKKKPQD